VYDRVSGSGHRQIFKNRYCPAEKAEPSQDTHVHTGDGRFRRWNRTDRIEQRESEFPVILRHLYRSKPLDQGGCIVMIVDRAR
jgi:hypothetical protein